MSFAYPKLLMLMMLVVPTTAFFLVWAWKQKQAAISMFVRSRLLAQLTIGVSVQRQWIKAALIVLAIACIFVALARPRWGIGEEVAKAEGVDIVVCVDVSRSMMATDVSPSRLARAKLACYDLLNATKTDRLGLVAFAGGAFLQCPLTLDDGAFRQNVAALDTDTIPEQGTALSQAIDEAKAAFGQDSASQKAIVIITDGEDHEAGAITAAKDCADAKIRIFTIGVGSTSGELLKSTDPYGNTVFFKDEEGNPVKSRLNEELLQQIAQTSGGFYLHLNNTDTMVELYRKAFANVAKTKFSATIFRQWIERFQWPLGLGILLLAVEILIPNHRRVKNLPSVQPPTTGSSKRPKSAATEKPPQLAGVVGLALLLLSLPRTEASSTQAETQYRKGKFDQALEEYEKLARENPNDARLPFNAGASAYRSGDYKKAGGLFEQALTAPDLDLQEQAWYNLGNTHYKLGEDAKEPDQKREQWNQALASYTAALKLNPQDANAKQNYETVKQIIEQMPPPPPEQQQQDGDKDKKDKKDQDKKDQQQDQKQNSKDGPKDQQKKDQQDGKQNQKGDGKKDKDGEDQSQSKEDKNKDKKPQPQDQQEGGKSGEPKEGSKGSPNDGMKAQRDAEQQKAEAREAQAQDAKDNQAGRMSARQAMKLLDNQKGEERAFVYRAVRARAYTNGEPHDVREARRKAW